MKNILIIDDDAYICRLLVKLLNQNGFHAEGTYTARNGIKKAEKTKYDLIFCDYRLPESDGLKVLRKVKALDPSIPLIIMTAYADVKVAVESIKLGAYDYVTKPIQPAEILEMVRDISDKRKKKDSSFSFQEKYITGSSDVIRKVMEHVRIVAPVEMTVMIEGETGSGKEFIARYIHYHSKRRNKPFIAVDCGALPKDLANSELFGHMKGSFTGASYDKKGVFELANGGTLFLDEIGNLGPGNQMKLLRALQERKISRIGDDKLIDVDTRIIVASNEDLFEGVKKNTIREDLYHRINEFRINMPPLRERGHDVLEFADVLVEWASGKFNKKVTGYSQEVRNLFLDYPWYGNIRELKNVVNRAVLLCRKDIITIEDIPEEIRNYRLIHPANEPKTGMGKTTSLDLKDAAQKAEKQVILDVLVQAGYNKSRAAKMLNIDRKTLYNKLKELGIPLSRGRSG